MQFQHSINHWSSFSGLKWLESGDDNPPHVQTRLCMNSAIILLLLYASNDELSSDLYLYIQYTSFASKVRQIFCVLVYNCGFWKMSRRNRRKKVVYCPCGQLWVKLACTNLFQSKPQIYRTKCDSIGTSIPLRCYSHCYLPSRCFQNPRIQQDLTK